MIDSRWENTGIIEKTLSKLVFIYGFNVVLGLLDDILELKKYLKHESEAGQALDHISIQISNFDTFTGMTLKLQEVDNFGMFFHVMQTIHFIHVCVR